MKAEQGKNGKMFSDLEYHLKIERLKEVRMPGHKRIPQDYDYAQRLVKVDKKDGSRKRYVTYEKLFEAIQEFHVESGNHTGRLLTFNKLKQIIIAYIECCETYHCNAGHTF